MSRKSLTTLIVVLLSLITILVIIASVYRRFAYLPVHHTTDVTTNTKSVGGNEVIELDAFTEIDADVEVSSISIRTGDSYKVEYDFKNSFTGNYEPKIEENGDTLSIRQRLNNTGINENGGHCNIVIYVPKQTSFSKIKIRSDVGAIEIDSVNAETTDIKTDVGDIDIDKMTAQNIIAVGNVGEIVLEDCKSNSTSLSTDVGDITAKNCELGSFDADNDVGDITLKNSTYTSIKTDANIGTIDINGEKHSAMFD